MVESLGEMRKGEKRGLRKGVERGRQDNLKRRRA